MDGPDPSLGPTAPVPTPHKVFAQAEAEMRQNLIGEAARNYAIAATQGHVLAQVALARMYSKGLGVEQSYRSAFKWYVKAGFVGHAMAQFNVGYFYEHGNAVTVDLAEAEKWYRKAAENGLPNAQYRLAVLLSSADPNSTEAFDFALAAAVQQFPLAYGILASFYHHGRGIERNSSQALKWCKLGLRNSESAEMLFLLGSIYDSHSDIRDEEAAFEAWMKAAHMDHPEAAYGVGCYHYHGHAGLDVDYSEALYWYSAAVRHGFVKAKFCIPYCHYNLEDYGVSFTMFLGDVQGGNTSSNVGLGHSYYYGRGTDQDIAAAVHCYLALAPDDQTPEVKTNLGKVFLDGAGGLDKDPAKALALFIESSDQGDASGMYYRGYCIEEGLGCDASTNLAIPWYEQAYLRHNPLAQDALLRLDRFSCSVVFPEPTLNSTGAQPEEYVFEDDE
ncbi:uncharacterized protein BJ171DRAFT_595794 [Polychytrium aggregatum]|uniref:uncharacterized protein n=1 Tax=Polychytrium aggregatum TaxID=110093 RepID=UPI0022FECA4E|nr:uncharacterized protein BJ171DRAFT_595794 [Polychytrium aggregatum]KAI9208681.1 hypothetical protein BJ171DRAFT_595794 [Polychytrium aggregatum]